MQSITFDDLEQLDNQTAQKPFFAIDLKNEDEILKWLNYQFDDLKKGRQGYLERGHQNYLRYKGYQYQDDVYYNRETLGQYRKYSPKIVLPMISDSIDEAVSRILELKPAVVTIPVHDEQKDKIDSKIAKRFLQSIDYNQNTDAKFQKLERNSRIVGESFLWIRWNPDLGEPIEGTKKSKKTDEGVTVHESLFQGDVEVVHKTANWLFYERADKWENVNYCFIVELEYTEALRLEYPKYKDKIKDDAEAKYFDYETMERLTTVGKVRKITFCHRRTKFLPQGFEAVFTKNALLKKGPNPYKHGKLPIIRKVDVENDEEVAGQAQIDKTKSLAYSVNNLLNSVVKMFMLAGYAKWFVEANSIDDQALNNDVNIVKIKAGAKPPSLVQANPVGAQHFNFIDQLKGWFYEFMKSNSIVRGEPPPGVTSGVALQYQSESESRRMRTSVANFNTAVRETYQMILDVAAQFYLPEDERTISVLGRDNKWEKYPLDISAIAKPYNVMIQNTSGLADSKAVRTQQVIDLGKAFPGAVPQEQLLEMTGLAQNDKFYDVGSAAVRAAEDENEWIQDGKGQLLPQEYEDQISHWKIHVQSIQSVGYKQKASKEIQSQMKEHIMAHEMIMMEMAVNNPAFGQRIMVDCPQFPIFMETPVPPPMPPQQPGMPAGAPGPEVPMPPQEEAPPEDMAHMDAIVKPMSDPMAPENPEFNPDNQV